MTRPDNRTRLVVDLLCGRPGCTQSLPIVIIIGDEWLPSLPAGWAWGPRKSATGTIIFDVPCCPEHCL